MPGAPSVGAELEWEMEGMADMEGEQGELSEGVGSPPPQPAPTDAGQPLAAPPPAPPSGEGWLPYPATYAASQALPQHASPRLLLADAQGGAQTWAADTWGVRRDGKTSPFHRSPGVKGRHGAQKDGGFFPYSPNRLLAPCTQGWF